MKLETAINAGLPLIHVRTRDTVNFTDVLAHLGGGKWEGWQPNIKIGNKKRYWFIWPRNTPDQLPWQDIYRTLVDHESSLIVANIGGELDHCFFDCGECDVPKALVRAKVEQALEGEPEAAIDGIMRTLGSSTAKDAVELLVLANASKNEVTQDSIAATRKTFFAPSKGFTQVDTKQQFYRAAQELDDYLDDEAGYFLTGTDLRLRARGLLLAGPPGTGKTSGAKYIAHRIGVPLFRLDIAGMKGKYVGQSEAALASALARIDAEAPAVVLIDEVEKLFGGSNDGDSHTTSGMLSQTLWWLQEHETRVLTIMTTNNQAKLPPELTRAGRLDRTLTISGLDKTDAQTFVIDLAKTFPDLEQQPTTQAATLIVKRAYQQAKHGDQTTPAALTTETHGWIKQQIRSKFLLDKITGLQHD